MTLDWHARYMQQAQWTKSLREYLFSKLKIDPQWLILEVGCGTGAVLSDDESSLIGYLHGIDIDYRVCEMATRNAQNSAICNADALGLPYADNSFDLVYCHYFLLWLPDPLRALIEIKRVLKPGGVFLVFAEPDYSARIDFPPTLERLGTLQTASLVQQGANPLVGRQLPSLFALAGFSNIQYGVSGFETNTHNLPVWWESEWTMLEHDLHNLIDPIELEDLRKFDQRCWLDGSRVLWVPTFYLSSNKPSE